MNLEYSKLSSISADEFAHKMRNFDAVNATQSDASDIKQIEALLELRTGVLSGQEFLVSNVTCNCGRTLTFYDLIASSLNE